MALKTAALLAAIGLLACTDLDALSGSPPPLPWSSSAPRGLVRAPGDRSSPRRVSTSLVAGEFTLDAELPRATGDCLADREPAECADVDRDGLVDEWEDIALDRLRPFVRIDEGDPLRVDSLGRVGSVGRIAPARDRQTGDARIRLYLVLGYSRDYGRCTFDEHLGDSERIVLDLAPLSAPGAVRVVGAFTASHEGTTQDSSGWFEGDGLAELEYDLDPVLGEPRWAVYSSRSKHATFASAARCEANESWIFCGDEDCAAGRTLSPPNELLMPVVNAG